MSNDPLPPLNSLQAFEAAGRHESFLYATLKQENAELHDRIPTLDAAILRIGAGLDPDTTPREVVDGARAPPPATA